MTVLLSQEQVERQGNVVTQVHATNRTGGASDILAGQPSPEVLWWFKQGYAKALLLAQDMHGFLDGQSYADDGERYAALIAELRGHDYFVWVALLETEPVATRAKLALAMELAHATTMFMPEFGYAAGLSHAEIRAAYDHVTGHFAPEADGDAPADATPEDDHSPF